MIVRGVTERLTEEVSGAFKRIRRPGTGLGRNRNMTAGYLRARSQHDCCKKALD